MEHQIGGRAVIPDLNLPPPEDGEQALPPAAAAAGVDRISSLPEKARLRILSFLPLKAVMAMWMVSKRWRDVGNQLRPSGSAHTIHVLSAAQGRCGCPRAHLPAVHMPSLASKLDARGRGPAHRLLHFIIKVEDVGMSPADLAFLLDYAAACDVEDVCVDSLRGPPDLFYSFQRASHHLVRLTLSGVRVDGIHHPLQLHQEGRLHPALEVIRIGFTKLSNLDLKTMLFSCPRLRVLDLRSCSDITRVDVTEASALLMSLTVIACPGVDDIRAETALGLRSFRYIGEVLKSLALPHTCFGDLYICLTSRGVGRPIIGWLEALPNLSNLTVLTICSGALRIVSALSAGENSHSQLAKLSNLQNLRELQLLMFGMKTDMLFHVYGFFRNCRCSQLRKLFVQLPKFRMEDSLMDVVNELVEEPPMNCFGNLVVVKITNFKRQDNEIELVHFLLRKASSLKKLILVAAQGTNAEGDQSGNPVYQDANPLHIINDKVVMLSNPSSAEIWAYHRDLSFEFY